MKEFLSHYGLAIVASVSVLIMLAFATPLGTMITDSTGNNVDNMLETKNEYFESVGVLGQGNGNQVESKPEFTTLTAKNWSGLTSFYGCDVWTDGENYYYSRDNNHYILNGDTWEPKTWNVLTSPFSPAIWTDGVNIYYSDNNDGYQLILNGDAWESKTWNGFTDFHGGNIWTDGTNTYYSQGTTHYVFS